jgi:hypothetical protein
MNLFQARRHKRKTRGMLLRQMLLLRANVHNAKKEESASEEHLTKLCFRLNCQTSVGCCRVVATSREFLTEERYFWSVLSSWSHLFLILVLKGDVDVGLAFFGQLFPLPLLCLSYRAMLFFAFVSAETGPLDL